MTKRRNSADTVRLEMPKANAEKKREVEFRVRRGAAKSQVFVAGTFNGWDPAANR